MIKKLIALIFSVACVSQFAAAATETKATPSSKEELVQIATIISEAKKAGVPDKEIAQVMLSGLSLTEEQQKKYIKVAEILGAAALVVLIEEILVGKFTGNKENRGWLKGGLLVKGCHKVSAWWKKTSAERRLEVLEKAANDAAAKVVALKDISDSDTKRAAEGLAIDTKEELENFKAAFDAKKEADRKLAEAMNPAKKE